ncbi:hypothetical protein JTB14_003543 [Gonioctena quinquepunctata]|nr:hypothetical protein JTB14_003543 [Gonioctena quinquepunctata]
MQQENKQTQGRSMTVDPIEENSTRVSESRLKVSVEAHRSLSLPNEKKRKVSETLLECEDPESPYKKVKSPEAFTLMEAIGNNKIRMAALEKVKESQYPQKDKRPSRKNEKQH